MQDVAEAAQVHDECRAQQCEAHRNDEGAGIAARRPRAHLPDRVAEAEHDAGHDEEPVEGDEGHARVSLRPRRALPRDRA